MKTVGEIIKTARNKKGLKISDVAEQTKINEKSIIALEENDYSSLPESAFVKGFIRNCAQVIGQDPKVLLAIFRRDYSEDEKGKVVPRSFIEPLNRPKLQWTPKLTTMVVFLIVLTLFSVYLVIQFRLLSGAPELLVSVPYEREKVQSLVTVEGETHPQATVTINSKKVEVGESGAFKEVISLTPGEHIITIVTESRTGKTQMIQRTVIVE